MRHWLVNFIICSGVLAIVTLIVGGLFTILGYKAIEYIILWLGVSAAITTLWTVLEWHDGINKW